jgi:small subunit ribosomal protein S29
LLTNTFPAGRSGCGKSFLLLQAVQYCASRKWIVIYIPRAVNIVNSTTPYTYDIRTQTYLQPAFAFQILQRMLTVNAEALSTIKLRENLVLERQTVPAGTPLSNLIDIAILERSRTVAQSPLILESVMRSLEKQKQ